MAQTATEKESMEQEQTNESNGGTAKTAARAAAIAAVSGATALAAKKAFGGGSSSTQEAKEPKERKRRSNDDVFSSMLSSAWDSARDSLVPMLEDAAEQAGKYLARSGPEIVRETIVPRFIDGFNRSGDSSDD